MFRRSKMVRDGRVACFLALGYLIWSLLPHAQFLVHTHANGESAHSHFSFHDLRLRNQTLVAANPEDAPDAALGRGTGESAPETNPANQAAAATSASPAEEHAFATETELKPLNLRHGHYTEDENILAIGLALAAAAQAIPHRASLPYHTLAPLIPYSGPTQARGPPSSPA